MHNHAFAAIGYNGAYVAFRVEDVAGAVTGIKALGICGASITIPHKISIMQHLDHIEENAINIGAVNTVLNRDGVLYGYNSDCLGAVRTLLEKTSIKGKNVWIFGAGGAARAIGFGILSEGGKVTILNRTIDKGERLANDLAAEFIPLTEEIKLYCDILINTTPLGMIPHTDTTPVSSRQLKKDMVVMDIVYNPLKTKLLNEADKAGCITIDGAAMFVYQGAFQFELWTGKKAPIAEMKQVVLEALAVADDSLPGIAEGDAGRAEGVRR